MEHTPSAPPSGAFSSDAPSPDDYEEVDETMRGAGRVIVVGGGRGGAGKSLLAANLAVYLAQLGKAVVLVDADTSDANLHAHFGLRASAKEPNFDSPGSQAMASALSPTTVPGLMLLPAAHDSIAPPLALRAGRKGRWLLAVRSLSAEYVVIDAGSGHGAFALDLMLAADIPILVTVPEPTYIEATYRFVRAAYRRRVRRAVVRDRIRLGLLERALREHGSLPSPLELCNSLKKMDRTLSDLAWSEAHRMRLYHVVNQTRVRTDTELGSWMSGLCDRHYGVSLEELGHIEHDDTVWLTVRRNKPLLIDSPTSKAARNLERIARRIVALTAARAERISPIFPAPLEETTLYQALGVTRSSSDEEIRRAYKKQREIYAPGGLATCSILKEPELKAAQAKLDEAYDTLLDPVRRRAYDLSMFAGELAEEPIPVRPSKPALAAEQLMLQAELRREIGPDTEFSGELLRKVRESQGIELPEISGKTKIARTHLSAIEEEDFRSLPAAVYVRGFLTEMAKFLRLDPAQVQRTYLRRMRDVLGND